MTSIGESLSGPDVTSPRMYKEFEWGYARRLVERLKARQIPLAYHICGNATRIVPDMVATGAAVLELDYKCDLPKIKQAAQEKTTILGVIDPSDVMARGTPDLVTQTATKRWRTGPWRRPDPLDRAVRCPLPPHQKMCMP